MQKRTDQPALSDTRQVSRRTILQTTATLVGAAAAAPALAPLNVQAQQSATTPLRPGANGPRQVGFVLSHEQYPAPLLVEYGKAAEHAGFDILWTSDHLQPWQDNQGHSSQAWITLAALAAQTQRIAFGTGVTCPTFRYHPSIVAQAFASLSLFAPGRVFLGVGTGEALNEQAATGMWAAYPERRDRLREAVELIRKLWSGEWVNQQGDYFSAGPLRLYDPPSRAIPLYIAASGPMSARLSGEHGDGWITDGTSLTDPLIRTAFEEGVRTSGRDPAAMPISVESFVVVGSQEEARRGAELWRFLPNAWKKRYLYDPDPRSIQGRAQAEIPLEQVLEQWTVSTDPEAHVQGILKLYRQGVTAAFIHSPQPDLFPIIDFYGKEVLPRLRQQIVVPNVVGLNEAGARQAIQNAGLFVSYADLQGRDRLGDQFDHVGAGIVVSSFPAAGTQVARWDGVTLGIRAP